MLSLKSVSARYLTQSSHTSFMTQTYTRVSKSNDPVSSAQYLSITFVCTCRDLMDLIALFQTLCDLHHSASVPDEQRKLLGIDDTLIRLSVGIESCVDLIADLDQALNAALEKKS